MNDKTTTHGMDLTLLLTVTVLLIGGLIMLYSASFFIAIVSSDPAGGYDPTYFFSRQLIYGALGAGAMIGLAVLDYRIWQKLALPILLAVIVMLIFVLIRGGGPGGTKSWIAVGSQTIQPSEFAKLALVLYMAAWLPKKGESIRKLIQGTVPFGLVVALVGGLVVRQPDYGTAIVLVSMAAALFFVAGADLFQLVLGTVAGGGLFAFMLANSPDKVGRFSYWWDPFLGGCEDVTYQMCQALMALGSGGVTGLGLGASRQKFLWLPAAQNDAIFAIIGEELGLIGAMLVIVLYAVFIYRGFRIALTAPDRFGALLAAGVTLWITVQTAVNLGGITASLPLTGVPLPFVSAGGSSLLTCMAGVGLMLSVSQHTIPEKKSSHAPDSDRWWDRWTRLPSFVRR
jgi:cell division protein FtsW